MYIVPSTETHFFSGDGGGRGGRLFEGGRLLQILNLRRGANSKRGAYLKLGANSSIYGNYFRSLIYSLLLCFSETQKSRDHGSNNFQEKAHTEISCRKQGGSPFL